MIFVMNMGIVSFSSRFRRRNWFLKIGVSFQSDDESLFPEKVDLMRQSRGAATFSILRSDVFGSDHHQIERMEIPYCQFDLKVNLSEFE